VSNITKNVEFLAGTDIKSAVTEAKEKASLWKVGYVSFDFNGQSFNIGRNADIHSVLEEYNQGGSKYGIVSA
jgi:hypothetical protein